MCLFLVFSAMPHLGSQVGAGNGGGDTRMTRGEGTIGSVPNTARFAVVEIQAVITNPENCRWVEPWGKSFRSPAIAVFDPIKLDDGSQLFAVHFESRRGVSNPIHFRVGPSPAGTAGGPIAVRVRLLIGGSSEFLPLADAQAKTFASTQLAADRDLFVIDLEKPEGPHIRWGDHYAGGTGQ